MQEQGSMPDMLGQDNQGNIVNQFANGTSWPNGNIFDELAQEQNTDITSEYDDEDIYEAAPIPMHVIRRNRKIENQNTTIPENTEEDEDILKASPISMHVVRRNRKIENQNTTIPENNNNQNQAPSVNDISSDEKKQEMVNNKNNEPETLQPEIMQSHINDAINKPIVPMTAPIVPSYVPVPQTSVNNDIKEKRKNKNTWQIVLFIIASIVIIGALVLAILAALGFFKKKDDTPQIGTETGQDTTNIKDNNININENNNIINNNNTSDTNIETHNNIDGQYDVGTQITGEESWNGIGKSDGLLTNGDINYTDRFKEVVSCENSPNVTYTLWEDLNGDGICQTNEILAKGKGFMVDGNCAIINGRKFPLTDNMQAYSNLNKLSNQELKVLNHTSTYWKDGTPHIIMDGLKTSVNIDTEHVGGVLNIEGYKIGDFSTTNISKNAFAKDVIESYLTNNNLTENQKKLISAWNSGRSSDNVKQLMEYHDMDNNQPSKNLEDTQQGKGQNM